MNLSATEVVIHDSIEKGLKVISSITRDPFQSDESDLLVGLAQASLKGFYQLISKITGGDFYWTTSLPDCQRAACRLKVNFVATSSNLLDPIPHVHFFLEIISKSLTPISPKEIPNSYTYIASFWQNAFISLTDKGLESICIFSDFSLKVHKRSF